MEIGVLPEVWVGIAFDRAVYACVRASRKLTGRQRSL